MLCRLILIFLCAISLSHAQNSPKGFKKLLSKKSLFIGRSQELEKVARAINGRRVAVLTGPQGIGKSSLALEYALTHKDCYDFVWWCDGEINFPKNIHSLANACGIPTKHIGLEEIVRAVAAYIEKSKNQRFLFIFKNVEKCEDFDEKFPLFSSSTNVHILFTAEQLDPAWSQHGTLVPIGSLDLLDSALVLDRLIKSKESPKNLLDLARNLGGFPLGLKQASSYLNQSNVPFDDYLANLKKSSKKFCIWDVALRDIKKISPLAYELLEDCSLLSSQYISKGLSKRLCSIEADFPDALKSLKKYSLIEEKNEGFKMDPTLQKALQKEMSQAQIVGHLKKLIFKLNIEFSYFDRAVKADKKYKILAAHLMSVLAKAKEIGLESKNCASLNRKLGNYVLYEQSDYAKAISYLADALRIEEKLSGEPQQIAELHHKIGYAKLKLGLFSEADSYLQKATDLFNSLYPEATHPAISRVFHDRAKLALRLGEYSKSQSLFERSLEIYRKYYGNDDHHAIGRNFHWLGQLRLVQGDYSEAIELFNKSIAIERTIHESDITRYCAESYLYLGKAHTELNHFEIAKKLFYKALAMDSIVYTDQNSPIRGNIYLWIGKVHCYLGDYATSSHYLREALTLHMRLLRTQNHLQVAATLRLLGRLALVQSDYRSARAYFEKTEKIISRFQGNKPHPRDARILVYKGKLEAAEGNYKGAIDYYKKALEVFNEVDGGLPNFSHRECTIKVNMGLAELELGNLKPAMRLMNEANALALRSYSSRANRITARAYRGMAAIQVQMGDFKKASNNIEEALQIFFEIYPSGLHEEHAEALLVKGEIAYKIGDYSKALEAFSEVESIIQKKRKDPAKSFLFCQSRMWKARIAYRCGNYVEAKDILTNVASSIDLIFPRKVHVSHALVLHFLSDVVWAQGNYKEAETYVEKAIECYISSYGDTDHSGLIDAWITLGKVVLLQGRYEDARTYLIKAVHLANRRSSSSFDLRKGKGYFWLGCLEKKLGNYMRAEICHRKGLYTLENVHGDKTVHPFVGYVCFEIADDLCLQNKPKAARYYLKKAKDIANTTKYPTIGNRVEKLEKKLEQMLK